MKKPVPGRFFGFVKWASWFEAALFAALLFFWIAPGFEGETSLFGLMHGLGFVALCVLIWMACLRREAPYPLLAATLTPVGPFGSVVGITLIERRGWGVAQPAAAATPDKKNPGQTIPAEGVDTKGPEGE